MPKVTVTDAQGLVQSAGAGVTISSDLTINGDTTFTGTVTGVTATASNYTINSPTITAAGNSQGTATAITGSTGYLYKVTGASGTGVVLAEAAAGTTFIITNVGTAEDILVYPPAGGNLVDKATNGGDKVSKKYKSMQLVCFDATPGAQFWTNFKS